MNMKKSISLPSHVLKAGLKKSELMHGGSFSAYVNYLICKDCPQEVKEELTEESKPYKTSAIFRAERVTPCIWCNEEINIGDECCRARHDEGTEGWAHKKCCRKRV